MCREARSVCSYGEQSQETKFVAANISAHALEGKGLDVPAQGRRVGYHPT